MLQNALNNWQAWNLQNDVKPTLIKTFTDGLNHHAGLIQSNQKYYVLKVFEHSAKQAIEAQLLTAQIGIAPKIHYFDDSTLVMDYVANNEPDYLALANSLSSLHCANFKKVDCNDRFDLLKFCQTYLASVDQEMQLMHSRLLPALDHFINDATPWCFCHNDLVVENCLFNAAISNNDKAVLIDWEYAQTHNPWFDLAAIIYYFQLSQQETAIFLEAYQAGWSIFQNTSIFYASQIALLWGDVLWHADKFGPSYKPQLQTKLQDIEKMFRHFTQLISSKE